MGGLFTTRHEGVDLFDAGFWLACEDEAGRVLRKMTAVDDSPAVISPSRGALFVPAP